MIIPQSELLTLLPVVKGLFMKWADFMYDRVRFNMPESEIHAAAHCERVLLYALIVGEEIFGDDVDSLEVLAHASVFHDTRREDEYLDTGHGARAAVYYERFCRDNEGISFHPEAVWLMRYHDLDDSLGIEAIRERFPEDSERVLKLYAVFKDADALDRWRLGRHGLDSRFLRTDKARSLVDYSRRIVQETMPPELLGEIEKAVDEIILKNDPEAFTDN